MFEFNALLHANLKQTSLNFLLKIKNLTFLEGIHLPSPCFKITAVKKTTVIVVWVKSEK